MLNVGKSETNIHVKWLLPSFLTNLFVILMIVYTYK
jgi:hypothetical protein